MKCENCGKNEVSFVYESSINGRRESRRLCRDCARKLGYADDLFARQQHMMQSMDRLLDESFPGGSLWGDFFGKRAVPGWRGRFFGEDLFDDFFREMPALGSSPETVQETPAEEKDPESQRFARIRQKNALRHAMHKAVREEDFEQAAKLRDELRALEEQDTPKAG